MSRPYILEWAANTPARGETTDDRGLFTIRGNRNAYTLFVSKDIGGNGLTVKVRGYGPFKTVAEAQEAARRHSWKKMPTMKLVVDNTIAAKAPAKTHTKKSGVAAAETQPEAVAEASA